MYEVLFFQVVLFYVSMHLKQALNLKKNYKLFVKIPNYLNMIT